MADIIRAMNAAFVRKLIVFPAVVGFCATAQAHDLPLGDGKISAAPRVGYVFSCRTQFDGGGAQRSGPWIGTDSWNPAAKPVVEGRVSWPDAKISITLEGDRRVIRANNLPTHDTGVFPIAPGTAAYRYDRNPNAIAKQNILLSLPAVPKIAATPSCVPMGMIGFALTGAAIFNALDAEGRDAPAHEIQDACDGHPQRNGQYHYHNLSPCMKDTHSEAHGHSDLVGYALDGFGIYGNRGENGKLLTDADLDACHGHIHTVMWNGVPRRIYHYHLTDEYPYTIGCFHGEVAARAGPGLGRGMDRPGGARRARRRAVLDAAAAELGVSAEALGAAIGPPPPDFARAAQVLGIPEEAIRAAMRRARAAQN